MYTNIQTSKTTLDLFLYSSVKEKKNINTKYYGL